MLRLLSASGIPACRLWLGPAAHRTHIAPLPVTSPQTVRRMACPRLRILPRSLPSPLQRHSSTPAWPALLLATPREAFAYAWPPSAAQDTEVKNDRYLEKMLEKKEKEVDSLNAKQGIKKKSAIKANADLKFQLGSQYQARPPPPLACPAYPCIAPPTRGASGLRPDAPGRGRKERHAAPRRAASPRPCPL